MGKTIRKTIQITTRKRHDGVKINEEFYSYDKNNAQFEFIMDYDIPADKVIALFHFEQTNRYYETLCQFKGNLITIEFDTSLIVEDELVTGYLYFDKLEKSTDVYRFTFGARLSEIDKTRELPVEEKVSRRIVPVADIVTKQELEELMDKIKKNGGTYDDTAIRELLATKADSIDVVTKQELETKGYITAHQPLDHLVTKEELEHKHYLTQHQSLEEYAKKTELYNDSALVNRVVALENKTDNDTVYNDTEVKERLTNLENKPPVDISNLATKEELAALRNSQPQVDSSNLVTKQELENKHYIQDVSNLATNAKVDSVESRVQTLENKPNVDLSHLVTKDELEDKHYINTQELENKGYLTEHQPLTDYAKRTELENLVTKQALEEKNYLTAHQSLDEYAKKSELYNDSALTERVSLLESKAIANGAYNDKPLLDKINAIEEQFNRASNLYLTSHQSLEHLVTKAELEGKGYLTSHQDISGLVTKEELASKNYLTEHQSLASLVTKDELEQKGYLTNHQDISGLATNSKVEAVEQRVQVLENKPDVDLSHVVTKEELAGKNYLTNHQPLDSYVTKSELEQAGYIKEHQSLSDYAKKTDLVDTSRFVSKEELESKGYIHDVSGLATKQELEAAKASIPQPYNDTEIRGQLARKVDTDTLATLATKQELQTNDEEVNRRLTTLEGKTDNFITGVSVNKEGSNVTLTYNYVDGQSKNVSFTDSDTVNVAYDDSGVKARLTNLENRPQIDVTTLVSKAELPNLIQHQSLEEYAKKSELPAPYNDSALVSRINALEVKTDNDTVYDDSEVKRRLTELEARPTGTSYNDKPLSDRVKVLEDTPKVDVTEYNSFKESAAHTVDVIRNRLSNVEKVLFARPSIPTLSLNDNTLSISGGNSVTLPTRQSEMRGTGMPNGVVEAPIGTNYIDTAKTNGALKWIKTTDGGNTGWKVLIGDTGWVLGWQEDKGENKNRMYFRRINNVVHVKFNHKINTSNISPAVNLMLDIGTNDSSDNLSIDGFKPVDDIVQTIYKTSNEIYSTTASAENSEGAQGTGAVIIQYEYYRHYKTGLKLQIVTSDLGAAENHVNPFSYLTEDEWPTTLPTI